LNLNFSCFRLPPAVAALEQSRPKNRDLGIAGIAVVVLVGGLVDAAIKWAGLGSVAFSVGGCRSSPPVTAHS
jgi:hypothetical protein